MPQSNWGANFISSSQPLYFLSSTGRSRRKSRDSASSSCVESQNHGNIEPGHNQSGSDFGKAYGQDANSWDVRGSYRTSHGL